MKEIWRANNVYQTCWSELRKDEDFCVPSGFTLCGCHWGGQIQHILIHYNKSQYENVTS